LNEIYLVSFIFITILLLYNAIQKNDKFLYMAAFLIPLQGLAIDFFVMLSWYKLIFIIGLFGLLMRYLITRQQVKIIRIPGIDIFKLYLIYIFLLTGIWWYIDSIKCFSEAGKILGWGNAQTIYRYPTQLISYIFVWGLVIIGILFTKSSKDTEAVINGYIAGNIFSIVAGFYQMIALSSGLPWFRDLDYGGFLTKNLVSNTLMPNLNLPFNFYRLYGFGGEPKHTASFAVIAYVLILTFLSFPSNLKINKSRLKLKLIIIVLGIIATASTGGWIALGLTSIYFIVKVLHSKSRKKFSGIIIVAIVLILLIGVLGFQTVSDLYKNKILMRFSNFETLVRNEPKDGAFIYYAYDNPETLFFGHGAGGIDFFIIPYTIPSFLEYGCTITPAYLPTRLLGDVGLVGIILLFVLWLKWVLFLKKCGNWAGMHFCIAGVITLLVSSQVALSAFLIICSSIVAITVRLNSFATSNKIYVEKEK